MTPSLGLPVILVGRPLPPEASLAMALANGVNSRRWLDLEKIGKKKENLDAAVLDRMKLGGGARGDVLFVWRHKHKLPRKTGEINPSRDVFPHTTL